MHIAPGYLMVGSRRDGRNRRVSGLVAAYDAVILVNAWLREVGSRGAVWWVLFPDDSDLSV